MKCALASQAIGAHASCRRLKSSSICPQILSGAGQMDIQYIQGDVEDVILPDESVDRESLSDALSRKAAYRLL